MGLMKDGKMTKRQARHEIYGIYIKKSKKRAGRQEKDVFWGNQGRQIRSKALAAHTRAAIDIV